MVRGFHKISDQVLNDEIKCFDDDFYDNLEKTTNNVSGQIITILLWILSTKYIQNLPNCSKSKAESRWRRETVDIKI